jgi:two-component system, NtrC family, response regulator AtoC
MNDTQTNSTARAPAPSSDRVLLVFGREGITQFALPKSGTLLIGRSQDAALRIREPWISREHARIHLDPEHVTLEDLGSANGTTVRERPLRSKRAKLAVGDSFQLGGTLVLVARVSSDATVPVSHVSNLDRVAELCDPRGHGSPGFALVALRVFDAAGADVTRDVTRDIIETVGAADSIIIDDTGTHWLPLTRGRALDASRIAGRIGHALASRDLVLHAGSAMFPQEAVSAAALKDLARSRVVPWRSSPSLAPAIFVSESMVRIHTLATLLAGSSTTVVVSGEPGVGKYGVAKLLHTRGDRAQQPFVTIDAQSDAQPSLPTDTGTLVIRHSEALTNDACAHWVNSAAAQGFRLVFVMTTGDARRAAGLAAACRGEHIVVPPLRERIADIEPLAHQFLLRAAQSAGLPVPALSVDVVDALRSHEFPENVRELRIAMTAALTASAGAPVSRDHLPMSMRTHASTGALHVAVENLERERVVGALALHCGNQVQAAKTLGIARNTLLARMKQFGLGRTARSA